MIVAEHKGVPDGKGQPQEFEGEPDLRSSFNRSFEKLTRCLREVGHTDSLEQTDALDLTSKDHEQKIKTYEKKVYEATIDVRSAIEAHLTRKGAPFKLGRAIVYLNSPVARGRIRIPLLGCVDGQENLPPQKAEATRTQARKQWKKDAVEGNSRGLMFFQPDKPTHLLTEHMWRLRSRTAAWGTGHALALFRTLPPQWGFLNNKDGDEIFCVCAGTADVPPQELKELPENPDIVKNEDNARQIAEGLGFVESPMKLWQDLAAKLNERAGKMSEGGGQAAVPSHTYTAKDAKALFARPLALLHRWEYEGRPSKSIFYISDICETEFLGAVDAEVIRCSDSDDGARQDLIEFLKDLQWTVAQYLLQLVSTAERTHQVREDTYAQRYFELRAETQDMPALDGLGDLIGILKGMENALAPAENAACKAVHDVKIHFELARAPIGQYWRGYDRWAFEVACTVACLIEDLFPTFVRARDHDRRTLTELVRQSRGDFRELDKALREAKIPFFIRQLFRGLGAEDALFALPLYRDHFIHSFHVFVLGLIFLHYRPKEVFPGPSLTELRGKEEKDKDEARETEGKDVKLARAWFIVAMWHDIAYSLEKGRELAENSVRRLLGDEKVKRFRGLLPSVPSLGHLFQVEKLIEVMTEAAEGPPSAILKLNLKDDHISVRDIVTAVGFDRVDHGIWSALLLAHALDCSGDVREEDGSRATVSDALQRRLLAGTHQTALDDQPLLYLWRAIIPHHVSTWEFKETVKSFYAKEPGAGHTRPVLEDMRLVEGATTAAKIDAEHNELGYLLALSDMLAQAGREAYEKAHETPSALEIRLARLRVTDPDPRKPCTENIEMSFLYGVNPKSDRKLLEEFYDGPAGYLGLNGTIDDCEFTKPENSFLFRDGMQVMRVPSPPRGQLYITVQRRSGVEGLTVEPARLAIGFTRLGQRRPSDDAGRSSGGAAG